jgi:hypothetical protein
VIHLKVLLSSAASCEELFWVVSAERSYLLLFFTWVFRQYLSDVGTASVFASAGLQCSVGLAN